jgi:hypothetical protein
LNSFNFLLQVVQHLAQIQKKATSKKLYSNHSQDL